MTRYSSGPLVTHDSSPKLAPHNSSDDVELTGHHAWALGRFMKVSAETEAGRTQLVDTLIGLHRESRALESQWATYSLDLLQDGPSSGDPGDLVQTSRRSAPAGTTIDSPEAQCILAGRITSLSHLNRALSSSTIAACGQIETHIVDKHYESELACMILIAAMARQVSTGRDAAKRDSQLSATQVEFNRYSEALKATRMLHKSPDGEIEEMQTSKTTMAAAVEARKCFWLPCPSIVAQATALKRRLSEDPHLIKRVIDDCMQLEDQIVGTGTPDWDLPQWRLGVNLQSRLREERKRKSLMERAVSQPPRYPNTPTTSEMGDVQDSGVSMASTASSPPRRWTFQDEDSVSGSLGDDASCADDVAVLENPSEDVVDNASSIAMQALDRPAAETLQLYDPSILRKVDNLGFARDTVARLSDQTRDTVRALLADVHISGNDKTRRGKTYTFHNESHVKRVIDKAGKAASNQLKAIMVERRAFRDELIAQTREYLTTVSDQIEARSDQVRDLRVAASREATIWLDSMSYRILADSKSLEILSQDTDLQLAELQGRGWGPKRIKAMRKAQDQLLEAMAMQLNKSEQTHLGLSVYGSGQNGGEGFEASSVDNPACGTILRGDQADQIRNEVFVEAYTFGDFQERLGMERVYRWEVELGRAVDDPLLDSSSLPFWAQHALEDVQGEAVVADPAFAALYQGYQTFRDEIYDPDSFTA